MWLNSLYTKSYCPDNCIQHIRRFRKYQQQIETPLRLKHKIDKYIAKLI